MDEKDQIFGEVSLWLVLGPFVLALCLFGSALATLSGRFLVDVVAAGGRLPYSVDNPGK